MDQQDNGDGGYDYPEQQDYGQMQQEDIQTTVQIDFFEAQKLIRNEKYQAAVQKLQQLYKISQSNNLRNWKPKILNHLLDLSCRKEDIGKIDQSLQNIIKLNQAQKLTDTAVKSVIATLKTLQNKTLSQIFQKVQNFFTKLDSISMLKGYLFMLQKAIDQKNKQKVVYILKKSKIAAQKIFNIGADQLLNFYSLQVKASLVASIDITQKLQKMEMRLSYLENQAYMNEGSLSVIKQALAAVHYKNNNYQACSQYLSESFQQCVRFGKNSGIKNLLKRSAIVSVLCDDYQYSTSGKYNPLYDQSSSAFKSDNDIFPIYAFIDAFNQVNEIGVKDALKAIAMIQNSQFFDLEDRIIRKLRKKKLVQILKVYKKVRFQFLERRIGQNRKNLEEMIFELIVDEQIRGKIHSIQGYIQLLPPQNQFLTAQLKNIQELSVRY